MAAGEKAKNKNNSSGLPGVLYVVATPIGNPADWTDRAKDVMASADVIAAEDTRLLKRELSKIQIEAKKVVSHHEHNEEASTKGLIDSLKGGENVALTSDAGTPLVSDPGYRLVAAAQAQGIKIVPVPGASSFICALSISSLGGRTVFFGGFLPQQSEARKRELRRHRRAAETLVFFEAPHRLRELLLDAEEVLGADTPSLVCRELTKPYEEIKTGSIGEIKKFFQVNEPRGEFVILFKGSPSDLLDAKETEQEVIKLLNFGRSASDILEELQSVTELNRKQLYDIIIKTKKTV